MARIKEVQKDVDAAFDLLDEAERLYVKGFFPDVRPLAALRARMWLGQDRLNEAMRWVHEHGLSVENDVSYLREFEHLTLARVLIARHRIAPATRLIHEAAGLLERLLNAAEEGERPGSVVEILAIQALAHEAKGDLPAALVALERALILAEPEGYVRIFVDEGEPMRDLLRHATAGGVSGFYTRRLLSACDTPAPSVSTPTRGVAARLVKPLTAREVEILRLIAAGLRNQEIADQLFISLSTVKRHIANAYGKMDVRHRTQAVARATELNLL